MRAMVRRTSRTRLGFSRWLVAAWKRRLNCSRFRSCSCCCSWSSVLTLRSSVAAMLLFLSGQRLAEASDPLGLDRQLLGRALERRLGEVARHAVELEQDAARLHPRDPELRRALARAHADFGRLGAHRNVRENANPETAGPLDVARDRATRGLDLARGDPLRLHRLQAEGAEVQFGPALGIAMDAALEGLAELGALGLQHVFVCPSRLPVAALFARRADAVGGVRLGLGVIDVAAQRVQRNPALAVPFGARDLRAAQAARAGDANALGAEAQRRL